MFNPFPEPKVPEVDVEEVKKAIDTQEKTVILDVRTKEEYEKSHLESSTHLPVDTITEKILTIIPGKSQRVYVYCLSGNRSAQAVKKMLDLGYTSVFSMSHGLLAWRIKHFPEEKN